MATSWVEELLCEGRTEGKIEGKSEGKSEGKAEGVITFLETRFGEVPQDICDRVTDCTDLTKLDTPTRLAASCQSIEEFKQGLK